MSRERINVTESRVWIEIPVFLPSAGNMREHWRARAHRTKEQRELAFYHLKPALDKADLKSQIVEVTFVREAPRPLDDDNLAFAFKAYRDGVADVFGVPDNDGRFWWAYSQEKAPKDSAKIRIELRLQY